MTDLIKELNQRRNKARNRLSEQFFNGLYDYIDLTVQHPLLQEILKQLRAEPNGFHSMWPEYNKLYTDVYVFIKENPYEVVKKRYKQYYKIDDDDFDTFFGTMTLLLSPFTIWALIKRIRLCYSLDRIHDGLITAIKTRSILSVPIYTGKPNRILPLPERKIELPHYDPVNGFLYLLDYKIKIKRQAKDTYEHQILKHIFVDNKDDLRQDFYYSDIHFDYDVIEEKENLWSRCRTACLAINGKILKDTDGKVDNFLIFNTRTDGWLNINPKYLHT